jgi:hypothetical protein
MLCCKRARIQVEVRIYAVAVNVTTDRQKKPDRLNFIWLPLHWRRQIMNIKKALWLLAVLLFFLMPVVCGGSVTGSSNIITREMDYKNFTKLDIGSAFEADVSRGESFFVSITANDNIFQQIDIYQSGRILHIGLKEPRLYIRTTQKVTIVMPELQRLSLSGASSAEVVGFGSESSVEFDLSGASDLYLDGIKTGNADFDLSGASELTGSLTAADCDFFLSGASEVHLNGTAADVDIQASGVSKLRLSEFTIRNAGARLSGSSKATLNVSGQLDVNLSGASELRYVGSPVLGQTEISG